MYFLEKCWGDNPYDIHQKVIKTVSCEREPANPGACATITSLYKLFNRPKYINDIFLNMVPYMCTMKTK